MQKLPIFLLTIIILLVYATTPVHAISNFFTEKINLTSIFKKDTSRPKVKTVFGKITSISNSELSLSISDKNKTIVPTSGSTSLKDKRGRLIKLSDMKVGHRVIVRGMLSKNKKDFDQTFEIKNYNIPIKSNKTILPFRK